MCIYVTIVRLIVTSFLFFKSKMTNLKKKKCTIVFEDLEDSVFRASIIEDNT